MASYEYKKALNDLISNSRLSSDFTSSLFHTLTGHLSPEKCNSILDKHNKSKKQVRFCVPSAYVQNCFHILALVTYYPNKTYIHYVSRHTIHPTESGISKALKKYKDIMFFEESLPVDIYCLPKLHDLKCLAYRVDPGHMKYMMKYDPFYKVYFAEADNFHLTFCKLVGTGEIAISNSNN